MSIIVAVAIFFLVLGVAAAISIDGLVFYLRDMIDAIRDLIDKKEGF